MPRLVEVSPYKQHVQKWRACSLCDLCHDRKNVVLYRGTIPCDILLLGEAPGKSEDQMGLPFIGPAGHLLDSLLKKALEGHENVRLGYTNLVCCFPKESVGYRDPTPKEIKACHPRLQELLVIAKPKLVVRVGKLADNYCSIPAETHSVTVIHPAAILKSDPSQTQLAIQRTILTLADAIQKAGL